MTCFSPTLEQLENRTLLSVMVPLHQAMPFSTLEPRDTAFTPAQLRQAYGINHVLGYDGRGQTIAIVDAYHDPDIVGDLQAFDRQFQFADPPSFRVLDQWGGTDLPAVDPDGGWALEEALDVEWAHVFAPGADIVLVECDSNSLLDLFQGIITAARLLGVSTVSMSFGGTPAPGLDTALNFLFATPDGHPGVTFVASSGDDGSVPGLPANSPNVLSVGGTTLQRVGPFAYQESAWAGSGGGFALTQPEPWYQCDVQQTGFRGTPDVAFDADPATGVTVYDSWNGHDRPWYQVGGTSVGAPCWAGILAVANEMRQVFGREPLNNPLLLSGLYNRVTSQLHDVTEGSSVDPEQLPHPGYDLSTGLGSPTEELIVGLASLVPAPFNGPAICDCDTAQETSSSVMVNKNLQHSTILVRRFLPDLPADVFLALIASQRNLRLA